MKRTILFIIIVCIAITTILMPASSAFAQTDDLVKSYYLVEYDSGIILAKYNENEKRQIASMVKIMTLLLTFEAIENGKLDYNQTITVSETASRMGGSQMFLDAHKEYPIKDLIKGVTVCSANDAAVALGETISGDIDSFVADMNSYAKELGMENTLFANTTGLPGGEQYSTAKDVSIMTRELLKHKEYYNFSTIWMEEYKHPDGRITEMVNTNKLIRFYPGCDSGKTGFTNDAMFCLSASAKRKDMRIVATVLGGKDSKSRFKKISELFNYAFANYQQKKVLKAGECIQNKLEIKKSKEDKIEIYCENDLKIFSKKNEKIVPIINYSLKENLKAPLKANTIIGKIEIVDEKGNVVSTSKLLLKNDVKKENYLDVIRKVLKNWAI